MVNLSVLVSGNGTNLQAIIDSHIRDVSIVQVISSKDGAFALERAAKAGIPGKVATGTAELLRELEEENTDLIVLAGYMKILAPEVVRRYRGRIINIHPSLIPKYCGKGYYGLRVHQAVLDGGETVSGATVHFVDEGVDTGDIILQRQVPVCPGDTAERLAARVLKTEHVILTEAIKKVTADLKSKEADEWAE